MYIYSLAGIIGGTEYWRIWKFDKIKVKAILILNTCSVTFCQFCLSLNNCNHQIFTSYTHVEWYTVKYYKINVQAKLMRSEYFCSNYMYSVHCINFLLKLNC